MRTQLFPNCIKLGLLIALIVVGSSPVKGDFLLEFETAFSGTAPASTNGPWITAWFQDVTPGTVRLTVSNLNLTANESVDSLYFNLSPLLAPRKLLFKWSDQGGDFDRPTISLGANRFQGSVSGQYDIMFSFTKCGTEWNRFTSKEFVSYTISGIPGLMSSDFELLSTSAGDPFYAVAHISRIGDASQSGWIAAATIGPIVPVPEPGSSMLLSVALGILMAYRFCKRSRALVRQDLQPIPIKPRAHAERQESSD